MPIDLERLERLRKAAAYAGPDYVLVCGPAEYQELRELANTLGLRNPGGPQPVPLGTPVVVRPDGGELHVALVKAQPAPLTEVERLAREELRESIAAAHLARRENPETEDRCVVRTPEQAERLLAMLDRLS